VVPLNTRFKGPEAAYVLRTAQVRRLLTVTDFLDTDYVALLHAALEPEALDEIVVLRGTVTDRCVAWPRSWRERTPSTRPSPRRGPPRSPPTTCATSCSRRAPLALPRERCCSIRRAFAPTRPGRTWLGCARATAISSSTRSSTRSG